LDGGATGFIGDGGGCCIFVEEGEESQMHERGLSALVIVVVLFFGRRCDDACIPCSSLSVCLWVVSTPEYSE
jgi:hypothetical protein